MPMNLFSLLDTTTTLSQLKVKNKKELISVLIDTLEQKIGVDKIAEVKAAVLEREKVMSTGVGKGLGIPHCKTKAVEDNFAAFALLDEPLPFDSIDEEPVRMVFLLVGPDSRNSLHIKLLSRISRLMNSGSFREQILACQTPEEILEAFQAEEEKYFVN
tara:strand:- start:21352 stop:21828 length:477 start_codon:yes stop_codon:yes gene_type:complete